MMLDQLQAHQAPLTKVEPLQHHLQWLESMVQRLVSQEQEQESLVLLPSMQ
jgi:hypothetical protein